MKETAISDTKPTASLTIMRPDDWHLHLRDGAAMSTVLRHSAKRFARALIMPNLKPPIINTKQAWAYRQRIFTALEPDIDFTPLMTLYLTADLTVDEISRAALTDYIHAVKLYPSGATTNSDAGITSIESAYPILNNLQKFGIPLSIHAEIPDQDVDIFDRERIFIDRHLSKIVKIFPDLRIIIEHITTKEAVQFVESTPANVAATITAHHLLYNRNSLLAGCIRPHFYCLPVLKREQHRQAILAAATSGNPKFFLGTDSAPHAVNDKECSCGCAGSFTAYAAIELYAEAFEQAGALDNLEAFASWHGADFYRLPRNKGQIKLAKTSWQVDDHYRFGLDQVVPLRAGGTVAWQLITN